MKKGLKIGLIILILFFGTSKLLEWMLESRFESIINSDPERSYNLAYEEFDLHTFFKGITLDKLSITPVNKSTGTIVTGTVDNAELSGFEWTKFLFSKSLKVDAIRFYSPRFNINFVADTTQKKKGSSSLQTLFSDILSRADLNDFQIKDGAIVMKEGDSLLKGEIHKINIRATEIETDSLQLTHIIPFKLGNIEADIESMFYNLNAYTTARLGAINYSIANQRLDIRDVSLKYDKDWVAVSEDRGVQDDVMEFDLKAIRVTGMNFTSSFWKDLDTKAHKIEVDSLSLSVKRNKNLRRPKDVKKDLFKGLVDQIPFNIDLDSITIKNSKILYGELSIDKQKTGVIEINALNGSITKFSTFPERKKEFKAFNAHLSARLNDAADMSIKIEVPYDEDTFKLHTTLKDMNMTALSSSLVPLLGVEINSGYLKRFDFRMNASYFGSQNSLIMDYDNLFLTVYKEFEDGSEHKKDFFTTLANEAIRQNNLPGEKNYLTAYYSTKRNIYRSPFQHIVAGALDGVKHIVPSRGLQSVLNKKGRRTKKRN